MTSNEYTWRSGKTVWGTTASFCGLWGQARSRDLISDVDGLCSRIRHPETLFCPVNHGQAHNLFMNFHSCFQDYPLFSFTSSCWWTISKTLCLLPEAHVSSFLPKFSSPFLLTVSQFNIALKPLHSSKKGSVFLFAKGFVSHREHDSCGINKVQDWGYLVYKRKALGQWKQ